MKVLVTGAKGFIGKNIVAELKNKGYKDIFEYSRDSDMASLNVYTKECQFVLHLAGTNRTVNDQEFIDGNVGFTTLLLELLKKNKNKSPVLLTSSIQAEKDNPYGCSKKSSEDVLFAHSKETGAKALVYRLPNLFGKWCRPNYNSGIATFCHNIARGLDIQINDRETVLTLCYIDDVIAEFVRAIEGNEMIDGDYCYIPVTYKFKLGEITDKLYAFRNNRESLVMPSLASEFDKALYGTYLSYLEEDNFSYKLKKNVDNRGWLAEFIKSDEMGQIFISKTKSGITRGNHWHHTKVEKFLVIQGEAVIKFRRIGSDNVIEYKVNGEVPEVVDIPVGYSHSIKNTGEEDVITLFWACEIFDPIKPDTYLMEV